MNRHRENVRQDILTYIKDHPGCTFQQMVDAWIANGKTLHSGILWEFVMEQGLSDRFTSELSGPHQGDRR